MIQLQSPGFAMFRVSPKENYIVTQLDNLHE